MAQQTLSRVAHRLRTAARPKGRESAESDHALLTRFVQADDEDAFRDLVRRHERTVLIACRQVLADPADVDDAFQATFLVLLKRSRSVDASTPLAGWLFAVAHRVAVKARTASRRRAAREAEAAQRKKATVELPDLTWREAAAVLHDELDRLPDKYRLPLLLCCVQGVTRDEAAEQLSTTVGAVRGQLERGRALLERRMTRRGIALSAGWLAVLVGSSRAADVPPAELIEWTLRAAAGAAPPAVAALARGAFPMTLLKRATVAALLLAGLLGVGIGLAGPRAAPTAADPPAAKAVEKPADERTITGTVLGADGKPIVADLYLAWVEGKTESLGKTKEDGTFSVTVKLIDPGAHLIAQAPGHGIEFVMPAKNTPAEVTFKLPKDNPIQGRVIDTQGKPVAGATVAVSRLQVYDKEPAERYLTAWMKEGRERGLPLPDGDRILWLRDRAAARAGDPLLATKTDKDGKFTLVGVGLERLAGLRITGTGTADKKIGVFNRPGFDPSKYNQDQRDRESMRFTFVKLTNQLMGAEPAVVVEQEKVLRGRVTDHAGKPRGGVTVAFTRPDKRDLNPDHNSAVTDKDGRYEIRGARKHKGYMVEVEGDPVAGLLPCQAFADDTVGYEPVTLDLKCARGLVVTGTIRDKATGKPVRSAVYASVLAKNPHVKDYPPFLHSASAAARNDTKDGRFRVVTIPGQVLLQVSPQEDRPVRNYKPVKADPAYPDYFHTRYGHLGYYGVDSSYGIVQGSWCKVLMGKPTDREITVDVELEEGTVHSIRVVDADGKPVTGASATGLTHIDFEHPRETEADKLSVYNVEPGTPRLVAVAHAKRKLVGTATIKADDKDPEVRLGAGGVVSGRVVDADGKPVAGAEVQLTYARREVMEVAKALTGQPSRGVWAEGLAATTGADGTFRFETVFPASEFRLGFSKGKKRFDPDYEKAAKHTVARHGDTLKVGDVVVTPKGP